MNTSQHKQCEETLARLQTFLDRELTLCDVEVVRYHLDKCPPCQHLFRLEEQLRRLVKVRCTNESAPPALRDQILAKMRAKTKDRTPGAKSQEPASRNI